MNRRGFTLIELIVALTIGTLVMGAIYQSIVGVQRLIQTHSERIELQQNLRAGAFYLSRALRELNAGGGDIEIAEADHIRFRSMRWSGVNCAAPVDHAIHSHVFLRNSLLLGSRAPDATNDSILVFHSGDPQDLTDDVWIVGQMTLTQAGLCTDGAAATDLTVFTSAADKILIATGVFEGAPVRGFQQEEIDVFGYWDGRPWLMQRLGNNTGGWGAWEGLLGPLQNTGGLELTYYDVNGNITAVLANIASVGIEVRGQSNRPAHTSAGTVEYLLDSLSTRVAMRNNQ